MSNTEYFKMNTNLPVYLPFPAFLLKSSLSTTAKLLYVILLHRMTLSQKNKWVDQRGNVFCIYPIKHMAEALAKGTTSVKKALNELVAEQLLERHSGGFGRPNRLYVKIPSDCVRTGGQVFDHMMVGKVSLDGTDNSPSYGRHYDLQADNMPSPNNIIEQLEYSESDLINWDYDQPIRITMEGVEQ